MTENINRAFMYGESVFTTMRLLKGVIQDWELHFDRMKKGIEFVYGPFTDGVHWVDKLRFRLESFFPNLEGDKIIRLAVYRDQARGLQRSTMISVDDLKIQLSQSPMEPDKDKFLKLRTCSVIKKPYWWPSYLKAGSYLPTILSQKMFLRPGDDDLLFMSHQDTVLESSVANIFVVRHDKLFTAPAGPDVLEGVMRKKVLSVAGEFFREISESETTIEQLMKADAIFGSNSVRGIFLVDRIDEYEITYKEEFLIKFKKLKDRIYL